MFFFFLASAKIFSLIGNNNNITNSLNLSCYINKLTYDLSILILAYFFPPNTNIKVLLVYIL